MCEVDLRLLAWRGLEAHLERGRYHWSDPAQQVGHRGIAAFIAPSAEFAVQPSGGEFGNRSHSLAQIGLERAQLGELGLAGTIGRWLETAGNHLAHRLAVEAGAPGDGRNAEALPMQIEDHDNLSQSDHRLPSLLRGEHRRSSADRPIWRPTPSGKLGNFRSALLGSFHLAATPRDKHPDTAIIPRLFSPPVAADEAIG